MEDLRSLVCNIECLADLVQVLNSIKKEVTHTEKNLFTEESLLKYSNLNRDNRYRVFSIPKKSGGKRVICAPCRALSDILYYLNIMLGEMYQPGPSAMGFVKGRSIVDNARPHIGHNYVLNLDLRNFFPSISSKRVFKRLQVAPFNFKEDVARAISRLCSIRINSEKGAEYVLPQGAPTSPLLTNAICDYLDKKLRRLARLYGLHYSRYADDMTFSSMHNVYQENSEFMRKLYSTISGEQFDINPSKTRLQKRGHRQEVTGLTVNDKLNTTHKYTRELRNLLFIWKQYGYKDAYVRFFLHYKATKGHVKKGEPVMENVILGKLDFLKMVKGANDPVYLNLLSKFKELNPCIYDSEESSDNKRITYIQTYSVPEFEELFGTTVKLIVDGNNKMSAVYKIGEIEHSILVSGVARELILQEKKKIRKKNRFTTRSLRHDYIALCRLNSVNFWMLLTNPCYKSGQLHPKYNNLPIDRLLDEWEKKGIDSAVELFERFENGAVSRFSDDAKSVLNSIESKPKKKRSNKKNSSSHQRRRISDHEIDMSLLKSEFEDNEMSMLLYDEDEIAANTEAFLSIINRRKDER